MSKSTDVSKLSVAQIDELFREAARSDEERAFDEIAFQLGRAFRERHPDFNPADANCALLENMLGALGLPMTSDNLDRVYGQLKREGSL